MRSRKVLTGIYSVGVTGVAAAVVSVVIYLNQQPMTGFPIFIESFSAVSKSYFLPGSIIRFNQTGPIGILQRFHPLQYLRLYKENLQHRYQNKRQR